MLTELLGVSLGEPKLLVTCGELEVLVQPVEEYDATEPEELGVVAVVKLPIEFVAAALIVLVSVDVTEGVKVCVRVSKRVRVDVAEAATEGLRGGEGVTVSRGDVLTERETPIDLEAIMVPVGLTVSLKDFEPAVDTLTVVEPEDDLEEVCEPVNVPDAVPVFVVLADPVKDAVPVELFELEVEFVAPVHVGHAEPLKVW